ncbi:MAG: TonB-dependent receptor plug domain-containing protein [Paludibacteraceae bacterium]|nr:TonB-dependent receptor plug domain-containing protein [Paludibacteraceae bacterium]
MIKRKIVLFILLFTWVSVGFAKMHIHTDASDYRAGERIWYRIHVLDAQTLLPDTATSLLIVELINPQGTVTKRAKLLRDNGVFSGYIDIPNTAEAGQYLIRSYPRGMDDMNSAGKQMVYIHGKSQEEQPSGDTYRSSEDSIEVRQVAMPLVVSSENGTYRISISTDSLHPGERVMVSASITDRYAIAKHPQWSILYTFRHPPFVDPTLRELTENGSVKGAALMPIRQRGINSAIVNMIIPGTHGYAVDTTDNEGRFAFADELVPEGMSVLLTAYRPDGGQNVYIRIEEETFPPYEGVAPAFIPLNSCAPVAKAELSDFTDSVLLDEIEVNAKRLVRESRKELYSMHQADVSFGMNKIEEYSATCLHDLLRRVPGVSVVNEQCFIRGAHSIYAKNPAAIAINGVIQEDNYDLDIIPMQDIARLDIFKSGTTVIWGARGGAGVISIILKDGSEIPKQTDQGNLKKFTPLGWQLPQDFYVQPYMESSRRPTTLLWIPDVQSQVLTFTTDGHPTVYDVVIEGVTSNGRLVHEEKEIY